MKMIRAIVRPDATDGVIEALAEAGFYSLTKLNVFGRGKQNGLTIGNVHYDEFPKVMIMMVAEDESVAEILEIIKSKTYTGNFGDGKIFTTAVEDAMTIRTGEHAL